MSMVKQVANSPLGSRSKNIKQRSEKNQLTVVVFCLVMMMMMMMMMMLLLLLLMMMRRRMTGIMIMMLLDEDLRLHADAQLEGWRAHPGVPGLSNLH